MACTMPSVRVVYSKEIRPIQAAMAVDGCPSRTKGQWKNMGKCCQKHARFITDDFELFFLLCSFKNLFLFAKFYVTPTTHLRTVSYRTGKYKAAPLRLLDITEEGVKRMQEPKDRNLGGEMLSSGYHTAIAIRNSQKPQNWACQWSVMDWALTHGALALPAKLLATEGF